MDRAINKKTGKLISAFEIYKDSSYQNPNEEEWIAPKDSIYNWEELDKEGIKEIKVHPVQHKEYKNWRGTEVLTSPYFAVFPNSKAKTVQETKEHKMLKNWIFNHLKKDDLKLIYATINKPHTYKNGIKLSELNIDWNNYSIPEPTIRGYKKLRADVLLPFKSKHELFGEGIVFEIQIQTQDEKTTFHRSIKWSLNGYSTVWLFEKDFDFSEDFSDIELKNKEPKILTYVNELYYGGKTFVRDLINTVKEQSQLLDLKIDETKNKVDLNITGIEDKIEELNNFFEEKYEEIKKRIEGFFGYKIKELSENLSDEVATKVQEDFFKNNKEQVKEIIYSTLIEYLKEVELEKIREKLEQEIDYDSLIIELKDKIENDLDKKLAFYNTWKYVIENPPKCSSCGYCKLKLVRTKKGTTKEKWKYVCDNCKTWTEIPEELQSKLKGGEYGEVI